MTIKKEMIQRLVTEGLFIYQAEEIMDEIEKDEEFVQGSMLGRWNDASIPYLAVTVNSLWGLVKEEAIEWLALHAPNSNLSESLYNKTNNSGWLKEKQPALV